MSGKRYFSSNQNGIAFKRSAESLEHSEKQCYEVKVGGHLC